MNQLRKSVHTIAAIYVAEMDEEKEMIDGISINILVCQDGGFDRPERMESPLWGLKCILTTWLPRA